MKYTTGLLFVLLPFFAFAQTERKADSIARAMLNDLMNTWTLGIDSTSEVVDIKVYNKFKALFDVNATIDDDLNVFYRYDSKSKSGSYIIKTDGSSKAFDIYAHDVALQIKSLKIDSVVMLDSNTADQKNMTFTISRRVMIGKSRQYVLPDTYAAEVISSRKIEFDNKVNLPKMVANLQSKISERREEMYHFTFINTIRITMALENDSARITSIKNMNNKFFCKNDADNDAVVDQEDSLKYKFGDFTAHGMPDYDLDGVPDYVDKCRLTYGEINNMGCPIAYFLTKNEFNVFLGLQFNSVNIRLPELNQLGYLDAAGKDAMDVLQSNKGVLKSSTILPAVHVGGNFTYYFGQKRKQYGISVGFTYSGITAGYQLTAPAIYTFKSSDGSNLYRRQITMDSLKEEIKYNIFNLPVMFNYRLHVDKKHRSVIKLQAGPSLLIFNNTSGYNATIDVGGLYQIDTINKNAIVYYDYFDRGSKYNVLITSGNINAANPSPGAENVFKQLGSSYDFANNKGYTGRQHIQRIAVAFNAVVDLQYRISEGLTINAGPHFAYAPLPERKQKYKPVERTTDEYQSIYKGNATSYYSAFGVHFGFVYNF